MSPDPLNVWVRDPHSDRRVKVTITVIPEPLRPDHWYESPRWRFSHALTRADVSRFFANKKGEIDHELALKLGQYIFDYAANKAVASYLFRQDRVQYCDYILPCIKALRELKDRCRTTDDVHAMIRVCWEYELDPL